MTGTTRVDELRIVYIGGWMRSGTTLLCEMVGAFDGVLALGEISGLWRALYRGQACSCGRNIEDCAVWGPALKAVKEEHGVGPAEYEAMAELTKRVLRTRTARELSRLAGRDEREWPDDVRRYVSVMQTLLTSVTRNAGARALVDSSKLPPGFLTLRLIPGARVDVLHIVRDARAVANSERKTRVRRQDEEDVLPPGRSAAESVVLWSGFNVAVWFFARHADSYRALRYEELTQAVEPSLSTLARALGLTRTGGQVLDRGHIAVGNPARLEGPGRAVRTDDSWRSDLPVGKRVLVTLASAPAAALFRIVLHRQSRRLVRSRISD